MRRAGDDGVAVILLLFDMWFMPGYVSIRLEGDGR